MSGLLSNGVWSGVALALDPQGVRPQARGARGGVSRRRHGDREESTGRRPRGGRAAWPQHVRAGRAQSGSVSRLRAQRPAAARRTGLSAAPDPAGLVRHDADQVAGAHPGASIAATKGSTWRATTWRCAPTTRPDGPMWLDTSISKTNMKSVVARDHAAQGRIGVGVSDLGTGLGRAGADRGTSTCRSTTAHGSAQRSSRRAGSYAWRLWSLTAKALPRRPAQAPLARDRRQRHGAADRRRAPQHGCQRPRRFFYLDAGDLGVRVSSPRPRGTRLSALSPQQSAFSGPHRTRSEELGTPVDVFEIVLDEQTCLRLICPNSKQISA